MSPPPLLNEMREKEESKNMEEGEEKDPLFADVTEIGFSVHGWPSPSGVPTQGRLKVDAARGEGRWEKQAGRRRRTKTELSTARSNGELRAAAHFLPD